METGEKKDGELGIAAGNDLCDGPWIAYAEPMSDYPQCQANARLIAAAPDLLEALKIAYSALRGTGHANAIRAAIKRAEDT
jgi:hypothetical protein